MIDRLTGIEAVLAKLISQVHKVALGKGDFVGETGLLGLVVGTLDLEVVVVETDNVGVREPSNLPSGSADTATDVENSHARLELHHVGEVVLVSGKLQVSLDSIAIITHSLEESFSLVESAKVERVGCCGASGCCTSQVQASYSPHPYSYSSVAPS
jgi:hypothetical protein